MHTLLQASSTDKDAQRRRALDDDTVYDEAKARRLPSLDDVPTSIRRSISRAQAEEIARKKRRGLLDDVPLTIRNASQQQQEPKRRRVDSQPAAARAGPSRPVIRRLRNKQQPSPEWQEQARQQQTDAGPSMLRAALHRGRSNSTQAPSAKKRRVERRVERN